MLIYCSALLALAFAWLILGIAHLRGSIAQLLAAWLLATGQVILSFLILNSFRLINLRPAFVAVQVALTTLALGAWLLSGRPSPKLWSTSHLDFPTWKRELHSFPQLAVLGALLAGALALSGTLVLAVIPNTYDSMTNHLSRVGYWLQNGSFFPWRAFYMPPAVYPVNADLLLYWTVLFHGTDELAGFVQWLAAVVLIVCVYGLARLLLSSRAQSFFAALAFGSFPLILMQSSSTQIDLTIASFLVPAIFFLLLGIKSRQRAAFVFSGLGIGLAVGAKQTFVFFLPGVALLVLLQVDFWKSNLSRLFLWLTSAIGFTLLLGVYMYVVNQIYFGNPLGPADLIRVQTSSLTLGRLSQNLGYNIPRLLYDAVDFSGLPAPLERNLIQVKARLVSPVLARLGLILERPVAVAPNHVFRFLRPSEFAEEQAWYGPLSLVVLLPAVLFGTVRAVRHRATIPLGLVAFAVSGLVMDVLLRPGYDEFQGRYLASGVAVLAPFMGTWVAESKASKIFLWVITSLAMAVCSYTMLFNPSKPVVSNRIEIFGASRVEEYALSGHDLRGYLRLVDRYLPERTTVAFYSPGYLWDYVLFGEHFGRQVIPVIDSSLLGNETWLRQQGVEYLLINRSDGQWPSVSSILKGVQEVGGQWRLYRRR